MKKRKQLFSIIIFDLSLLFMLTMYLNVLKIESLDGYIRGTDLIFGTVEPLFVISGFGFSLNLESSFLHFTVYFLPIIISIILIIIGIALPKFHILKIVLNIVLFIVFGFIIYFFLNLAAYSFNNTIYNALNTFDMKLAIGSIFAIILASLAFVFSLINIIVEVKNSQI